MRKSDKIVRDVFGEIRLTYPVRGDALKRHRTALGVSRKDFAKLCGWTIDFQVKLEVSGCYYLPCFQRDEMVAVIIFLCLGKNLKQTSYPP